MGFNKCTSLLPFDRYIKDLKDGRTLYINSALGCLRQVRFNVRPEITVFELMKKV